MAHAVFQDQRTLKLCELQQGETQMTAAPRWLVAEARITARTRTMRICFVAALLGAVVFAFAGSVTAANASGGATGARASSISRAQAVRKAKEYLVISGFSRKGLIGQLKYEGFSTSDAIYGASHSGANWYKQAARKAKEYLKVSAFSRASLLSQLMYDGFTRAQALYGVRAVGL
jgi:hypothetical protein